MRACNKCGIEKDTDGFNKGWNICKVCRKKMNRRYYLECTKDARVAAEEKRIDHDDIWKIWYSIKNRINQRADKRGFTITSNEFKHFWNTTPDECVYCGTTVDEFNQVNRFVKAYRGNNRKINKYKHFPTTLVKRLTVDRINNAIGYQVGNLCKACYYCNAIKGNMLTSDEMMLFARQIKDELITAIKEESNGN
jgi:hypothetical protein